MTADQPLDLRAAIRADRFRAHEVIFRHRHEYPFAPFHPEIVEHFWSDAWAGIALGFRECGKTTLVEEGVVIAACEGAFRNCLIIGAKEELAAELLINIKSELDNNDALLGIYGDQHGATWTGTKVVLKSGVCIQARGVGQNTMLRLNVSPAQLVSRGFVGSVAETIDEFGIDAGSVCLEITERAVVRDIDTTRKTLEALKEVGVQIAIDDFGTGYAVLSHLKSLPVDTLKIDTSFVRDGKPSDGRFRGWIAAGNDGFALRLRHIIAPVWNRGRDGGGQVDFANLSADDARAVKGVFKPEIGGEGMVRGGGDDAVFEGVTGLKAEDADGFDADVLVGGGFDDGGVGRVGDGAGEDVDGAAAGVSDADERDFDLFEGTVEVEIQAGELAGAEFVVDFDAGVNFFAAVAIGFEPDAGFEEFDFGGKFGCGLLRGFFGRFFLCFRGNAFSGLLR